jgi:acyl-CoA hydrolase
MAMQTTRSVEQCVDAILAHVGPRISIATPLGLGKPNHLLNAFYRRALADRSLDLTIQTGLSLQRPVAHSELEQRLLDPIVARVFGNYPDLEYEVDRSRGRLPANVRVIEFYLQAGKYLHQPAVQRDYISANFTHVARDVLARGVNVLLQSCKAGVIAGQPRISLSSNADLTLDVLRGLRERESQGARVAVAAQLNDQLPFMHGDALLEPEQFDFIVDDPAGHYTLFAPPRQAVGDAETMIGLHASTLVKDGGELQVGIGALGDAVVYALGLRHTNNSAYRRALTELRVLDGTAGVHVSTGGLDAFDKGVFAASEMLVDGFMQLFRIGVLKRKVYDDITLSRLLDTGRIDEHITPELLDVLCAERAIAKVLAPRDLAYLQQFGILRADLHFQGAELWTAAGEHCVPDLDQPQARALLHAHLGKRLRGGAVIHAGFFVGPGDFYTWLRELPEADRELIHMRSVTRINQLYGHEQIDRLHRRDARFINTTLKMSLLGAACSDALPDGRIISGVGGQYEFVAMAHALPGGRSILQLRSTRLDDGRLRSNLTWDDSRATIPRHLRDIVVTEYGSADLRSKTDEECVVALLNLADSRFQAELVREATRAGKLRPGYAIPDHARANLPESYGRTLAQLRHQGLFPRFPFGTDLTPDEQQLTVALRKLKAELGRPKSALEAALRSIRTHEPSAEQQRLLERMQLASPRTARDRVYRRLLLAALNQQG